MRPRRSMVELLLRAIPIGRAFAANRFATRANAGSARTGFQLGVIERVDEAHRRHAIENAHRFAFAARSRCERHRELKEQRRMLRPQRPTPRGSSPERRQASSPCTRPALPAAGGASRPGRPRTSTTPRRTTPSPGTASSSRLEPSGDQCVLPFHHAELRAELDEADDSHGPSAGTPRRATPPARDPRSRRW